MALLLNVDRVKYTCTCGLRFPLCKLYLCRYCKELRCKICVSHEPDNFYCPHCIEGITGPESRERNNHCLSCFNCPSCGNTLTSRLTTVQTTNPENPKGEPLQRKQYYLSCACCKWSTRDADIPDVQTNGAWRPPRSDEQMEQLLVAIKKYWATVGAEETIEAQTKKFPKRKSFAYKRDLFQRRRSSVYKNLAKNNLLSPNANVGDTAAQKSSDIKPEIQAFAEVEALPESYWTQPLNVNAVTSLNQRIAFPSVMPETAAELHPMRKNLTVKRSLRCPGVDCDHNLVKPEYVPQSIKFKLHLVAQLFVPEVRLAMQPSLEIDKECECVLTVTNPTDSIIRVKISPIDIQDEDNSHLLGDLSDELNATLMVPDVLSSEGVEIGGKLSGLELAAGESLSGGKEKQYEDDPEVIVQRKINKVYLKTKVVPSTLGERIVVGMDFDFMLMTEEAIANKELSEQLKESEENTNPMSSRVIVDLGFAH